MKKIYNEKDRMRIIIASPYGIFIVFFSLLLLYSCDVITDFFNSNTGKGDLRITIDDTEVSAENNSFLIEFNGPGENPGDRQTNNLLEEYEDMDAGYWTVTITAFDINDIHIGQGERGFRINNNKTMEITVSIIEGLPPDFFIIDASAGSGGSIEPSGKVRIPKNGSQTFSITPSAYYKINDVDVDGSSIGPVHSYHFTDITGDHTISATFTLRTCIINATAGPGGTIDPVGSTAVTCGNSRTFNITPSLCYDINDVLVDGESQGPVYSYTFENVIEDHTISATFIERSYTITTTSGYGGSIDPEGEVPLICGDSRTFTFNPIKCNTILDVIVDGESKGIIHSYTFENVTEDHTISVTFNENTFTITTVKNGSGIIAPGIPLTYDCDFTPTYTITAEMGYSIESVTINGIPVERAERSGRIELHDEITGTCTIEATFRPAIVDYWMMDGPSYMDSTSGRSNFYPDIPFDTYSFYLTFSGTQSMYFTEWEVIDLGEGVIKTYTEYPETETIVIHSLRGDINISAQYEP